MAYWVQEVATNQNLSNYRSFICDYRSDILNLPTHSSDGLVQDGDTISSKLCAPGSDCFCLEDASAWVLGKDTNTWQEI